MNLSHEMPRMTPEGKDRTLAALADPCGAWLCAGTTATLRRRNRRGVVTVCLQCDGCGRTLGGAMKRADHYYWQDYLEWDETLSEEQAKRRENWQSTRPDVFDRLAEMQTELRQKREEAFAARREEYRNVFLRSPEWRRLRERVLWRSRGWCEACLQADATDVHHLTYDLGKLPPAWELKAVCRACHDRLHDWERTEASDTPG